MANPAEEAAAALYPAIAADRGFDSPRAAYIKGDAAGYARALDEARAELTRERDRWKALAEGERERIATRLSAATGPALTRWEWAAYIRRLPAPTLED